MQGKDVMSLLYFDINLYHLRTKRKASREFRLFSWQFRFFVFHFHVVILLYNLAVFKSLLPVSRLVRRWYRFISKFSIITQVIIEILALSLAENGVIFRYNHLRRGDYSGRTNFQNSRLALCQCAWRGNYFNERKCHFEEYQTRHKVRNDTLQR